MNPEKVFLITGCTSGIGYYTTLGCAPAARKLILVSRSTQALEKLAEELKQKFPALVTKFYTCDFADLEMVVAVSKRISAENPQIDVLVNNAGTWEGKNSVNKDGFELTWTVNYFAPYIFTKNLLGTLKASAKKSGDGRIIILGSEAHRQGKIDFNDLFKFGTLLTYSSTKKADMLWANKLARTLAGTGIKVNSLHPGVVTTGLWNKLPRFLTGIIRLFMITPAKGAETSIYLATTPNLKETGEYWDKCKAAIPTPDIKNEKLQDTLDSFTRKLLTKYLV